MQPFTCRQKCMELGLDASDALELPTAITCPYERKHGASCSWGCQHSFLRAAGAQHCLGMAAAFRPWSTVLTHHALAACPAGPYDPRQYLGGMAAVPDSWKVDLPAERAKAAKPWQLVMDHVHRHGEAHARCQGPLLVHAGWNRS